MKNLLITALILFLITGVVYAQSASYEIYEIDDAFSESDVLATATQQNAVAVYQNYVFVTYYNSKRKLCLARNSNYGRDTNWKVLVFDYTYNSKRNGKWDNHNTTNVVVSPIDRSVHLTYDHHGSTLKYRVSSPNTATVSDKNFTIDRFSNQRNYLKPGNRIRGVTYPRFVVGTDGTIVMAWRKGGSGKGDSFLARYNGKTHEWSAATKFVDGFTGTYKDGSTDRCAYFNDLVLDRGRVHATWTWRESGATHQSNHDLMYAYTDDNGLTWKNNSGQNVGTSRRRSKKMNLNSPVKVVDIPQNTSLLNHAGMAIDGNGYIHAIMKQGGGCLHMFRKNNGDWVSNKIPTTEKKISRPKVYASRKNNTVYMLINDGSSLVLYATKANRGRYNQWKRIKKINKNFTNGGNSFMSEDGNTLTTIAVTKDNTINSVVFDLLDDNTLRNSDISLNSSLSVLNVSPNPVRDILNIDFLDTELTNAQVKIFNISGKLLYKQTLSDSKSQINVNNLANGLYLLEFIDDTKTERIKFIKE